MRIKRLYDTPCFQKWSARKRRCREVKPRPPAPIDTANCEEKGNVKVGRTLEAELAVVKMGEKETQPFAVSVALRRFRSHASDWQSVLTHVLLLGLPYNLT